MPARSVASKIAETEMMDILSGQGDYPAYSEISYLPELDEADGTATTSPIDSLGMSVFRLLMIAASAAAAVAVRRSRRAAPGNASVAEIAKSAANLQVLHDAEVNLATAAD